MKTLKEMNLVTKVSGSVNKSDLLKSVREALGSERFKIGVMVDKAGAAKAVREALDKAGLKTDYTAGDLRMERARATAAKAEAYINGQRELARQRAASAAKAELGLAAARERSAGAADRGARASLRLGEGMGANVRIAGELKNQMLGVYSLYTVERFVSSLVRIRGEFDMQLISLKAILQSGEKAAELFEQIKSLSVISPFQFRDLIGFAKQLSAYQIPNSELFDTTKRLADLSAGLGVDMNRIILAYGQVRSAAFLRGQELRQFTEAGIPMVQALADKFSLLEGRVVSAGEVFDKISGRKVPFEMVKEVMEDLTDEGGRFYMMQEKQAESLRGKVSNLRDTYDIMMNSIGEANDGLLKGGVDALSALMENMDKFTSALSVLLPMYGAYRTIVLLNNLALGKETKGIIVNTLAHKAKTAEMLQMAGRYRDLTGAERMAISTRRQMTTSDWMAAASSGALSREYALRLVRLGRLTEMQALELTQVYATGEAERILYQCQVRKAALMRINIRLGQRMTRIFGAFGVTSEGLTRTMNGLTLGLSGVGRGVSRAISSIFSSGNIVMMAIAALGYVISNFIQEGKDFNDRIRQTGDAIKDSYDELSKFLAEHPLNMAFSGGDEGVKAFADNLEKRVKESSPISMDILAEAGGIEDDAVRLKFLRDALEDTARAYLAAGEAKDVFEEANKATDDFGPDDRLSENLNDYAESLGKFNYALNSIKRADILADLKALPFNNEWKDAVKELAESGKSVEEIYNAWRELAGKKLDSENVMPQSFGTVYYLRRGLDRAKKEVEDDFETFYGELETQIKNRGIEVDSKFGKTWVERLKKEFYTQNKIQLPAQELFDFKLDSRLYDGSTAVVKEIARVMKLKGKEAVRGFSDTGTWSDGMKDALDSAIGEIYLKFPEFKEAIDRTVNGKDFVARIRTVFEAPEETEVQKWARSVYLSRQGVVAGVSGDKSVVRASADFNTSGLRPGNDDKSFVAYLGRLKKEADEFNDKIDELEKVWKAKKDGTVKKELDAYIRRRDDLLGQLDASGYEYIRKGGGDQGKDLALESLNERFRQVKDFMALYEKLSAVYGKADALTGTKGSGLFAAGLFKDSTVGSLTGDVRKEVGRILGESGNGTKDRRSLTESALSYQIDLGVKVDKENLDRSVSEIGKFVSEAVKKWEVYKKALEVTNQEELSMRLAFGGHVDFGSLKDEIEVKIREMMESGRKVNVDFGSLVGMDTEDIGREFGKPLANLVKSFQEESGKMKEETAKNFLDILKRSADFGEQISGIDAKLRRDLADLEEGGGDLSDVDKGKRRKFLTEEADKKKSSIRFDAFKESSDWVKVFDDLHRVSTGTLNEMTGKIGEFARQAGLSERVTKQLVEAMAKLREESIVRNPLEGLIGSMGKHSNWKFAEKKLGRQDSYTFKRDEKGFNKGQTVTRKGVENGLAESNDDMEKSALDIANKFKAVGDAADMLGGLFGGLGMDMDGFMGSLSDVLGGAAGGAQAGAGIADALGVAGPWGAAAGAAVGMLTSIFELHDKKLEEDIKESKNIFDMLGKLKDLVDESMEHWLGSGADMILPGAEKDVDRMKEISGYMDDIRNQPHIGLVGLGELSAFSKEHEKLQRRTEAYKEGGAYGYQRNLMQEQVEELERQNRDELAKSKHIDYAAVEARELDIEKLKQEMKDFAEETADALYGINLKDWASQLGDALFDAWKKGEDGAEAFRRKVVEIMGGVMNSALKLGVLEPAMKKLQKMLFGEDGASGMLGKDFKLDESEMERVADELMRVGDKTDAFNKAMDQLDAYMKRKYGTSMKDEADGGGLSKGIAGITENTADLLASYLNSVRADVAAELALARMFVLMYFPRTCWLAEAQLTELRSISRNTGNNVALVSEIRDMLHAARLGKDGGFWMK